MTAETIVEGFAQSYGQARDKFLAAAEAAGAELHAQRHPLRGVQGEELAMDAGRLGAADAQALLIVSSACHGVEGFCGSGIQVALLRDADLLRAAAQAGVALLFVHGLNPWGFSWWRRTTQENVDLNRNFVDFHVPLPVNDDYLKLARAGAGKLAAAARGRADDRRLHRAPRHEGLPGRRQPRPAR